MLLCQQLDTSVPRGLHHVSDGTHHLVNGRQVSSLSAKLNRITWNMKTIRRYQNRVLRLADTKLEFSVCVKREGLVA